MMNTKDLWLIWSDGDMGPIEESDLTKLCPGGEMEPVENYTPGKISVADVTAYDFMEMPLEWEIVGCFDITKGLI